MTPTTPDQLYMMLLPPALASYAAKNSDMTSAKQMADALARECVLECMRLGILGGGGSSRRETPQSEASGPLGIPQFAGETQQGSSPGALTPVGAPQQPAQHYNHVMGSPVGVGGVQIVPAAGGKYDPPAQAGVMSTVTQAPNPQGQSALGTNGVINQPEQRPNGKDVIVAPQNQPTIPSVGGASTTFIPERIVR